MVLTQEQFLISCGMPNISFFCEQLRLNTLCSFLFFSNIKSRVYTCTPVMYICSFCSSCDYA